MSYIDELGTAAKKAELAMTTIGTKQKNSALEAIAESLIRNKETIIKENKRDIENAKINGMSEAMIDRLTLTESRIAGMSEGVRQVMELKDPNRRRRAPERSDRRKDPCSAGCNRHYLRVKTQCDC